MTTLPELQDEVDSWIETHGGYWSTMSMLARFIEETGEMATDLNVRHGEKPGDVSREELVHEVGDVMFTLICLSNELDIDLEAAVTDVMEKYDARETTQSPPDTDSGDS